MSLDQLNSHIDALVRTTFIYEVFSDEKSETNDKGEEIISASIYGYTPLNDTFGGSLGPIDFADPNFQFDACYYQGDFDKNGSMIGEIVIGGEWEFNGIKGVDFNPFKDDFNEILLDVVDSGFYDVLSERYEYINSIAYEIDECDFDNDEHVKKVRNGLIFPKKIKNKEVRNLAENYLSELKKSLNYQNNNSESWLE